MTMEMDIPARNGRGRRRAVSPALSPIEPTDRLSVERQVYLALRYGLMTGRILPGARLTTRSLSLQLGVSPTPVREALKRLEGDGALVSKRQSAFLVSEPTAAEFAEILEIRLKLEGLAIRKATRLATVAKLKPIVRINATYLRTIARRPANSAEALAYNFKFHFELYKLSNSPILVSMIEALWLRIGPTLHHYAPIQSESRIADFHTRMIEAVEAGAANAAERALKDDLVAAGKAIIRHIECSV
jgi:DNA-binding GntR family transcriptional regulator